MTDVEERLRADAANWRRVQPAPSTLDGDGYLSHAPVRPVRRITPLVAMAAAIALVAGTLVALAGRHHPQTVQVQPAIGPVPLAQPPLLMSPAMPFSVPSTVLAGDHGGGVTWNLEASYNPAPRGIVPTNETSGLCLGVFGTHGTPGDSSVCLVPKIEPSLFQSVMGTAHPDPSDPVAFIVFGVTSTDATRIVFTFSAAKTTVVTTTVTSRRFPGLRFFSATIPAGHAVTAVAVGPDGQPIERSQSSIVPSARPSSTGTIPDPVWPMDPNSPVHFASPQAVAENFVTQVLGLPAGSVPITFADGKGTIDPPAPAAPVVFSATRQLDGSWAMSVVLPEGGLSAGHPNGFIEASGRLFVPFAAPKGTASVEMYDLTGESYQVRALSAEEIRTGEAFLPGTTLGSVLLVFRDSGGHLLGVGGTGP
jgi:hypothetical protein